MRTALISDIHGNLEALTVVLADIDARGVDQIICLGDTLGYGPDPVACVDLVSERCAWSLMGNHDFGALYEPTNFNSAAELAAYWTRDQLEMEEDEQAAARRWNVLGSLRVRTTINEFLCVHGSPRRPINEYIFPEDAINSPVKMQIRFQNTAWSDTPMFLVSSLMSLSSMDQRTWTTLLGNLMMKNDALSIQEALVSLEIWIPERAMPF